MKKVLLILAFLVMSGCVTLSYRRGASGEAMSADEKACREATETHAAYLECLDARGTWVLETTGAASEQTPAAEPASIDSSSPPTKASPAPAPAPAPAPTPAPAAESAENDSTGFGTLSPDERDAEAQPLIGSY
jgi:uncharacterized protein YceK